MHRPRNRPVAERSRSPRASRGRSRRVALFVLALVSSLGFVPVASAHGGHVSVNGIHVSQWYGLVPLVVGTGMVLGSRYLPRVLRPAYARYELYGILSGLVVAVFGAVWLVQFSPYDWLTGQPLVPRALHDSLLLLAGGVVMLGSVLGGRLRWPTRPRFAGLGVVLGLWVAYPGLASLGVYTENNPLGYLVVLALPVALGYVLWRDAGSVLRRLAADRMARRFGTAVGLLSVVFFVFSSGMLYFIPDDGTGISLSQPLTAVMPVADPLVVWPAFEFWFPSLPLGGMISPGTALLLSIFGCLIGLNAALFAFQSERPASGASRTTAGVAGIAAPQACCCCGPALSQVAVVTLGPSAATPIYLLFADPSSSVGSLFFVASVAVLTGTLVRAGRTSSGSTPEQRPVPAIDETG